MRVKYSALMCLLAGLFSANINANEKEKDKTKNQATPDTSVAKSLSVTRFDISLPLRIIAPKAIVAQSKRGGLIQDPGEFQKDLANNPSFRDPVLQSVKGINAIPAPLASFNALTFLFIKFHYV
jgi:hypothetical protein